MANLSFDGDFSSRLRYLQGKNDWTIQEMADLAGIPKRSLENYMRKTNPQVPGVDVVLKMANGFGLPVDWLLLGADRTGKDQARVVRLCARAAALPIIESFIRACQAIRDDPKVADHVLKDGTILGLSPEEWAMEIANDAGRRAEDLSAIPARSETLRIGELAVERSTKDASEPKVGRPSANSVTIK